VSANTKISAGQYFVKERRRHPSHPS